MSKISNTKQDFLLTFFDNESKYKELNINGFWLVKHWNGDNGKWQVAIFTKESIERYRNFGASKPTQSLF